MGSKSDALILTSSGYTFASTATICTSASIRVSRRDQNPDGKYDINSSREIARCGCATASQPGCFDLASADVSAAASAADDVPLRAVQLDVARGTILTTAHCSTAAGSRDGISSVRESHVNATSNLFSRFTMYACCGAPPPPVPPALPPAPLCRPCPCALADRIMRDRRKMCCKSSSRIMPLRGNGLISRIVTTWASMSHSHCGSTKYRSRSVASS